MVKIKPKKNSFSKKINVNVTNFSNSDSFFFDVTKIYPCISQLRNLSLLNANNDEIDNLKKKY